jgi:hypothetical protein
MKKQKRRPRLSQAEKEKILELRRAGKRMMEIALHFTNISLWSVKYCIEKAGLPTGRGSGFKTEQTAVVPVSYPKRREILRRLRRFESVHSIARRLRVSRRFVWTMQRKHGIKSLYRKRIPLALRKKIACFPGSARAAAQKYGVSGTFAQELRKFGE